MATKKRKKVRRVQVVCRTCGRKKWKGKPCRSHICTYMRNLTPRQRRMWRILTVPPALALIVGDCLVKQHGSDRELRELGERVLKWTDVIFDTVRDGFLISPEFITGQRPWLFGLLDRAWPEGIPLHAGHVTEVVLSLVMDTIDHLHKEHAALDDGRIELMEHGIEEVCAPWNWLECALSTTSKILDPEQEGHENSLGVYELLRSEIWGEPLEGDTEPPVKLFEVGERFVVAAHSRRDAREYVQRETGLVHLEVKGCAPGAKIETETAETYGELATQMRPGDVTRLEYV